MTMRLPSTIVAILLGIILCQLPVEASGGKRLSATSEQLQALFVQRLVKYVSWPEGSGPEPGKPFIVAATQAKRLRPYFVVETSSPRFRLVQWPVEECHVLVVNGAPDREAAAILNRIMDRPVLTIGQSPANLRAGAIVNFQMVDGKIALQINPDAAKRADLFISSRLLKIARLYRGGSHE